MNEPEHVDPKRLRPGPIRNESLPPELLEQIKAVFDVVGPYISMTLEQFEVGFMRDTHPESEVACGAASRLCVAGLHCRIAVAPPSAGKQLQVKLLGYLSERQIEQ